MRKLSVASTKVIGPSWGGTSSSFRVSSADLGDARLRSGINAHAEGLENPRDTACYPEQEAFGRSMPCPICSAATGSQMSGSAPRMTDTASEVPSTTILFRSSAVRPATLRGASDPGCPGCRLHVPQRPVAASQSGRGLPVGPDTLQGDCCSVEGVGGLDELHGEKAVGFALAHRRSSALTVAPSIPSRPSGARRHGCPTWDGGPRRCPSRASMPPPPPTPPGVPP